MSKKEIKACIYDALINGLPLERIVLPSRWENLFVVPATIQLAGAEVELVLTISREVKLKEALAPIKDNFSIILIDCPPSQMCIRDRVKIGRNYRRDSYRGVAGPDFQ